MARTHYQAARRILHDIGNLESDEAYAIWGLEEVHEALGEFEAAADGYEEARRLSEATGASFGETLMLLTSGVCFTARWVNMVTRGSAATKQSRGCGRSDLAGRSIIS